MGDKNSKSILALTMLLKEVMRSMTLCTVCAHERLEDNGKAQAFIEKDITPYVGEKVTEYSLGELTRDKILKDFVLEIRDRVEKFLGVER